MSFRIGGVVRITAVAGLFAVRAIASGTLTNCDFASFQSSVSAGGTTTVACDGTILMTATIPITRDTVIDATHHSIVLDGDQLIRHFIGTNQVKLMLIHLTLANGRFVGADAGTITPGQPAGGGSIYSSGGSLELIDCVFTNNQVSGGNGKAPVIGPVTNPIPYYAGSGYGGAVFSDGGQISALHSVFVTNSATGGNGAPGGDSLGGAIFIQNGTAQFQQSRFINNVSQVGSPDTSGQQGGGRAFGGALVQTNSTASMEQCLFDSNRATVGRNDRHGTIGFNDTNDYAFAYGGAIVVQTGSLLCSGTLFTNNSTLGGSGENRSVLPWISGDGRGGAICNLAGELDVQASAFVGNMATGGDSGAVLIIMADDAGGAGYGGAIYNLSLLNIVNTTFNENTAVGGAASGISPASVAGSAYGGAIFNYGTNAVLKNVTFATNFVVIGKNGRNGPSNLKPAGALGSSIDSASGSVTLWNTILACAVAQTNVTGAIVDGGHNLCSDDSAHFTSITSRSQIDPRLAPLALNGGATPTLALLPDSPAIDAGDNTVCPGTDQRGILRPQGPTCDIGAFELQPSLILAPTAAGKLMVEYVFQAGQTNTFSGSVDFKEWDLLGTKVAGADGKTQLEQFDPTKALYRFYRVESP